MHAEHFFLMKTFLTLLFGGRGQVFGVKLLNRVDIQNFFSTTPCNYCTIISHNKQVQNLISDWSTLMSSNNQRTSRRATASTRHTSQQATTTSTTGVPEFSAARRATRTTVQAVKSDKKTYFVDSDDEPEITETKPSPSKRSRPFTHAL